MAERAQAVLVAAAGFRDDQLATLESLPEPYLQRAGWLAGFADVAVHALGTALVKSVPPTFAMASQLKMPLGAFLPPGLLRVAAGPSGRPCCLGPPGLALDRRSHRRVLIRGYKDNTGSEAHSLALSRRRADAFQRAVESSGGAEPDRRARHQDQKR